MPLEPAVQALNEYNGTALTALYPRWAALSLRERFLCLTGFRIEKRFSELADLVQKHEVELSEEGWLSHFKLQSVYEDRDDIIQELGTALTDSQSDDPLIQSEMWLAIGFVFWLSGQLDLAEFYVCRSREGYRQEQVYSHEWRADLFAALCLLKRNKMNEFKVAYAEIEKDLDGFSDHFRVSFARTRIWLAAHLGHWKEAQSIAATEFNRTRQLSPENFETSSLAKYLAYLNLKNKISFSFDEFVNGLKSDDIRYLKDLHSIQTTDFKVISDVKPYLEEWGKPQINIPDRFHLFDLLLSRLVDLERPALLLKTYQAITQQIPISNTGLFPNDLRQYGILAYRLLGQSENFERLYLEFKAAGHPGSARPLELRLREIGRLAEGKRLVLDLPKSQLLAFDQVHDLSQRSSLLNLLDVMVKTSRQPLDGLAKLLFPDEKDALRNLEELLSELRTLLHGTQIFLRENDNLVLAEGYEIHVRGRRNRQRVSRRNAILRLLNEQKTLSISDLERRLGCARRSLQKDLLSLVREGKIETEGAGRSLRYRRLRTPSSSA